MSKLRFWSTKSEEAEQTSLDFAQRADTYELPYPIGEAMVFAEAETRQSKKPNKGQPYRIPDAKNLEVAALRELERVTGEVEQALSDLKKAIPKDRHASSAPSKPGISHIFDRDSNTPGPNAGGEGSPLLGRLKKSCGDVCVSLDNYSGLFKFVPTGDKFVTLATGIITTIVEATVRHRKIGNGFAGAMDGIRDALIETARVVRQCETYDLTDKARLQARIASVFVAVTKILISYLEWCSSRFERVKSSLNKNFYDEHVTGAVEELKDRMDQLFRERETQFQMLAARQWKKEERQKRKEAMDRDKDRAKDQEQLSDMLIQKLVHEIGKNGISLNKVTAEKEALLAEKQRFEQYREKELAELTKRKTTHLWQMSIRKAAAGTSPEAHPSTGQPVSAHDWETIELASSHLEAVADNGYPLELPGAEDVRVTPVISARLHDWLAKRSSEWLWLCRYGNSHQLSEVSIAAFYILLLCQRLRLPVLGYRLRIDDMGLPDSVATDAISLRSVALDRFTLMLYSLIRQLVWLLPGEFQAHGGDFSENRFLDLDGSTSSLPDALNLVEDLLALMPEPLVCIIDGFQLIDNDSSPDGTSGYIECFLQILREAGALKRTKILICSDGYCRTLQAEENIAATEQLHGTFETEPGSNAPDYIDLSLGPS